MPFDALGNFIPDDELSLDAMKYELAKRGSMPLRPDGSDVPYVASQVPTIRVPVTPKEPPKPYSTATNIPQAIADRLGITAIPQALMALATDLPAAVASETGYKDIAKAIQYQPSSRMANQMLEVAEQAPRVITGSHMGFGPLAETWMPMARGISPDDVRVMGKRAIETGREIRAIPEDFANAQSGITRLNAYNEPTYGARLQAVAEDIGDVTARRQAMGKSSLAGIPEGFVEVFDPKLYAVRNTGEGQMVYPKETKAGVSPDSVTYGNTEAELRSIAPELSVNRPEAIIDSYEQLYMSDRSPASRSLQAQKDNFFETKAKEMFPPEFTGSDALRALERGYPPAEVRDMKLKWFQEFIEESRAQGFNIPSMEEYLTRAQGANLLTRKIIPNIIQKYIGTPADPFLESAKKGITMNPAEELIEKFGESDTGTEVARQVAGFEPKGEIADKLMPVAMSKLNTQNQELDTLIAEQAEIGRTEGMVVPYPDGRIDPDTGQVAMATNPNYAQYSNKIGAMRKAIEDTEEEIRKLQIAQAYENVSDASIQRAEAAYFRQNIPPEEEQFFPQLFGEKKRATRISPVEYLTPGDAPFFETSAQGLKGAGIIPLTQELVQKIMRGEIPPDQIPTLSQPHTITKFMADIVAPRIEKEKAARLAQKDYKNNVMNHFLEVLKTIPESMRVGKNAKLLWIDDATPEAEINQALSDETFILDHCIGNSGSGRGTKHIFTGDDRQYIPYLDPATQQKFKNAGGTSSYMDAVKNGEKDIMMIRDDKTGMPVGTIELNKQAGADGTNEYSIGYVSGYKNHSNKFDGIDPQYSEAIRDALNMVKDEVTSSDGNEARSGVFDMNDNDQLNRLKKNLPLPSRNNQERSRAWAGVQQILKNTIGTDRFITFKQAQEALKQYISENPPVPEVRSGFPPAGKEVTERNIIMQGLSRDNLNVSRQFDASRLVSDGNRFANLPSTTNMEEGPRLALQTILRSENRRASATQGISDYQLFRNIQSYIDQINDGSLRFGDFGLRNGSDLLELQTGLQRHADAIGQLAHYADVLQRNGYRSPLPSENLNTPEWQAYQRFIGELGIDDPQDLRTRLRDMIIHGDPREVDPNLNDIQRENFKHLLEIHDRSINEALTYPAPTAPAQQRGIPLRQFEELVENTINEIGTNFGEATRQEVNNIFVNAIGSQMDVAVNERPVQVANFLNEQAREAANPVAVRNALRVLAGAIDQANADIQNARNAPVPALPTDNQLRDAINAGFRRVTNPATRQEVEQTYNEIATNMVNGGQQIYENPIELTRQLLDRASFLIGEGEPDVGNGLAAVAGELSNLLRVNPPASMALANQNAIRNQPTRELVVGQEALSNSILDAMNDITFFAPVISDRLNALQWRENLVNDPMGLVRNIRIEADAEALAGNEQLASKFYDIANLIADENGQTMFTPAPRQNQAPAQSSLDLAMTTEGQRNTNRVEQVVALRDGIDRQLEEINNADRYGLMGLVDYYADANQLPDRITDHTNSYDDAVRIADYLRRHAQARLDAMPPERSVPTATMPTPRDVAMSIAPDSVHQSLPQRQRQVELLTEGINNQIRSLPTTDERALREALEFYRDYDNLPTDMMARIPSQEDAERVLSHIRQHIQNRLDNLNQQPQQNDVNGYFNRINHIIDDTILTVNNNPRYADMQNLPSVLEREINEYYQNSENLPQFIQYLRDDLDSVVTNHAGDEFHDMYADEMRHLIDRLERVTVDLPQLVNQTFHQQPEPAQLPAPVEQQNQQISDAITRRSELVNQNHLGISQRFDSIVRVASNEANPQTNPVEFIQSLHHRANSVDRVGNREDQVLANMLRGLADDVNNTLQRQVDPIRQELETAYNIASESIRTRHPMMIEEVMRSPNTRANLADVVRADPMRYGLQDYSEDVVNHVAERLISDGLSNGARQLPAPELAEQHFSRVEQGVNQPEGLGALNRTDQEVVRRLASQTIAGQNISAGNVMPAQREMANVLFGSGEATGNALPAVEHIRLIRTLTSETYNPATDGEALIRLLEQRAGMFANLEPFQSQEGISIVNNWNSLRFPNYRPPEEGMGLEPQGRKRGGFIRKMNQGGEPPKLTPYEQFKIDNAERIRQGNELNENRNKYDPYKGSGRPIPTQKENLPRRASGSAGVMPSGSGPSYLDKPSLYAVGGKVYMEFGGKVRPVPNIPATPEKTRPNPVDHVIRKPADKGFPETLERIRNTPKPSGSAGAMPSGSGPSSLDRPSLYSSGGNVNIDAMRLALMKG